MNSRQKVEPEERTIYIWQEVLRFASKQLVHFRTMAPVNKMPASAILLFVTLICTVLPVPSVSAQAISLPITQRLLSTDEKVQQGVARLAHFRSIVASESGGVQPGTEGRSLAVSNVPLFGSFLYSFTVEFRVGTPARLVPLVLDTGSGITFIQGPNCVECNSGSCVSSPFGINQESRCPYSQPKYNPTSSSTAVTQNTCASCTSTNTGCLNNAAISPSGCQFLVDYGDGNAAGLYIRDKVTVGPISTGNKTIFFGVSLYQAGFTATQAGRAGFGPTPSSLPAQLKQAGALTTTTFSLCLRSGTGGGLLTLDGIPVLPGNTPYDVTYTALTANPSPIYTIPAPTEMFVNGVSINVGSALALDAAGSEWVVATGTTISFFPTTVFNALFRAIQAAVGCPTVVNDQQGLFYIDLASCSPTLPNYSLAEVYKRFPTVVLRMQGTRITARPKSYVIPDESGRYISPGFYDVGGPGNPGQPALRIIGDSYLTDNLVVFEPEKNRVGFAAVDCSNMQPYATPGFPAPAPPAPTPKAPTRD